MLFCRRKKPKRKAEYFSPDGTAVEDIDYESAEEENAEKASVKSGRKKLRRFLFKLALVCLTIIAVNAAILFSNGFISPNEPRKRDYPTRGAVLTDTLGEIRWGTLEKQNMSFAYLRATNGKSFIDKSFEESWQASQKSELMTGAYHDFDFKADGKRQGENFCKAVGETLSGRLVPAIDVTMTMWERFNYDDSIKTSEELAAFIDYVSGYYDDCKIIIICDKTSYGRFVKSDFSDYPLWVKSTSKAVDFADSWQIWQYSDKGKSDGYEKSDEYYPLLVAKKNMSVEQFRDEFLISG